MNRLLLFALAAVLAPAALAAAAPAPAELAAALSPGEIVEAAPASDWVAIAPADLLVMELARDAKGRARRVTIQLMPAPFSQGWIGNVRKLAAAHWWDGLSVNRVQDNYVVQWGDSDGEDKAKAKKLPEGLSRVVQDAYSVEESEIFGEPETIDAKDAELAAKLAGEAASQAANERSAAIAAGEKFDDRPPDMGELPWEFRDPYAHEVRFHRGWPSASSRMNFAPGRKFGQTRWPIHCYGMVGVGRDLPPDTGSGAELYTVIGHAPRHLDRNIALIGRVIEGIEHLSSLPRGTGALGVYETAAERVPIVSVRLGSEMEADPGPRFEYLSTESASFASYADARANRRDAFFVRPAGGADICNIPVPVRRVK